MAPPPRPWVTYGLIAANVLAFVASVAAGVAPFAPDGLRLFEVGGNWGPATLGGEPWRLVSSMFLHAGVMHLAMNMVALHDGGRQLEVIYGRAAMGAIYAVAGLCGSLASALHNGPVSVGASGAVFGLFGAFGGFLLRHRDRLDPVAVRVAGRGLAILFGMNLVLGLSIPGIDYFAHLGGAVGGFLAGWAVERLPRGWALWRRAVVVAAAALALVGAVVALGPRPRPNAPVVVAEFTAADDAAVDRLRDLFSAPSMSPAELAAAVERDILAPYHTAFRALEDGALDERWSRLRRIARQREAALVALVAALRADDTDAATAAFIAWRDALETP